MTQEFTTYFLLVMITLALGFVVQFFLAQLKNTNLRINRLQENIVKLHEVVRHQNTRSINSRKTQIAKPVFGRTRYVEGPKTLEGDLELHYMGESATTRAVFKLDHKK